MRFSLNWLRTYVEIDEDPKALAHRLTMAGLPVDQVEEPAAIPESVVVGRVLEAQKHPNADRLSVCRVDAGEEEPLTIVCGAPNARDGIYVAVAKVGSTLPNGITIKKAKIRGESSRGMLCSAVELGLGEESDGIMELDPGEIGSSFAATLQDRDTVLEIDIPSNRGDCLSHCGLAREIAALTGKELNLPEWDVPERGEPAASSFKVDVEDIDDCPRFTAHVVRDIKVGPSPPWLVERLESVGQRSINNVVDVSNFVMLEMGQPTHAFDLARLGTDRILVRRARDGETITTLDDTERRLTPEVLLITDGDRPIAAGGIMGGANTEVHDGTTDVLLEAAWFQPQRVLRGSRALRLDTDASLRFRRGIDPGGVARAAKRAATLIAELCGGTVAPGMVEVLDPDLLKIQSVTLRPERVEALLGEPIENEEIETRLKSLAFEITRGTDTWSVGVPSWRRDIFEECDLVEEVGRHRGYDTIGVRQFNASAVNAPIQPAEARRLKIRGLLNGMGFFEAITRTLTERTSAARVGLDPAEVKTAFFPILDPPSREEEGLRVSLAPSLLAALSHNLRHGQAEARLYEIGKTFVQDPESEEFTLPRETTWVGLAAAGGEFAASLQRGSRSFSFSEFKGMIEELVGAFRIDGPSWRSYTGSGLVPPGAIALVCGDETIGFAWETDSEARSTWDLNRAAYVAQVRIDALPPDSGVPIRYQEPSRYPAVRRDLALVVPEATSYEAVREWINTGGGSQLTAIELFDHYRGKHIPEGHVGLGFSLTFRAADRTLEEKEVDAAVDDIVAGLKQRGIVRREG